MEHQLFLMFVSAGIEIRIRYFFYKDSEYSSNCFKIHFLNKFNFNHCQLRVSNPLRNILRFRITKNYSRSIVLYSNDRLRLARVQY